MKKGGYSINSAVPSTAWHKGRQKKNVEMGLDKFSSVCYSVTVIYNTVIIGGYDMDGQSETFYGYYSSKEALFTALVEPHAAAVMGMFMQAQTAFSELPETEQPSHVGVESRDCVKEMLDYVYQHLEPFRLLVCKAQGTGYENFIHNMVEIEVEATQRFMEVLRRQGRDIPELDDQLCHIIASGMFHGIFEVVVHDMPYDRAKHYVKQLQDFFLAGWHSLMGV